MTNPLDKYAVKAKQFVNGTEEGDESPLDKYAKKVNATSNEGVPLVPAYTPDPSDIPTDVDIQATSNLEAAKPGGMSLVDTLAPFGQTALEGINIGAVGLNRAAQGVVDLVPNLVNLGSHLVGSDIRSSTPTELLQMAVPSAKKAFTPTELQQAEDSFVLDAVSKGVEFYGGGRLFTQIAGLASKPVTLQSTTGQRVVNELSKTATIQVGAPKALQKAVLPQGGTGAYKTGSVTLPHLEAGASLGAAVASEIAERTWKNPMVRTAFEIVGGIAGGATAGVKGQISKQTKRAAEVLQAKAANPERALRDIQEGKAFLTPVEASDDLGIFSLYHSLAREDHALEQKYKAYVKQLASDLENEVQTVFGEQFPEGGYFQSYIKSQEKNILGAIEDRLTLANQRIVEAAALGGRDSNDINQSILIAREIDKYHYDISQQNTRLWDAVSTKEVIDLNDLKKEATTLVKDFTEYSRPSKKLLSFLEQAVNGKIIKTPKGYTIKKRKGRPKTKVRLGALSELRSEMEAAKRAALTGQKGNPRDARQYTILSNKAADMLLEVDGVGGAWDVARSYTARTKEVFNQGAIGRSLARAGGGDVRVPPEKVGKTLLGGGKEDVAVGAREIDELAAIAPNPGQIKQFGGEYLLSQFQHVAKESPKNVGVWMDARKTALQRFPFIAQRVKETVKEIEHQQGRKLVFEDRKSVVEGQKFFEFSGVSPRRAVGIILDDPDPVGLATQLVNRLGREASGDAVTSFKRSIGDYALEAMRKPSGEVGYTNARTVMTKLKPLLETNLLTKGEKDNLQSVLKALELRYKVGLEKPLKEAPVQPNMLRSLTGAFAGSAVLRTVARGAQSIILAGAAARLGREAATAIPDRIVKDILAEAMLDEKLMMKLLSTDPSAMTSESFTNVISSISASAASQYSIDTTELRAREEAHKEKMLEKKRGEKNQERLKRVSERAAANGVL